MIAQGFRFRFPMSLSVKPIPVGGLICSDDFNRANGAPGDAPVGGYTWSGAGVAIAGNTLVITPGDTMAPNGVYPWQDVDARVDTTHAAGAVGLWIVGDTPSPANAVRARYDGANAYLGQIVGGVYTNKITSAQVYVPGATLRIVKSDTTYTLFYNGTAIGATTITGMTGYHCGAYSTNAANSLDNWAVYRTADPFFIPLDVPQSEADALIYLYEQTDGGSWTTNTNWLTSSTVGTWHGVTVAGGHVTAVDLNTNNLIGTVDGAVIFAGLPSLTHLYLYDNAALLFNCVLSDLPATMTWLNLFNTDGVITGGGVAMVATSIRNLRLDNCALTNGQTNSIVDRIYADRALFTAAAPNLHIGRGNTAPSGIYQAGCPPTTQLEEAFELVNDSCGEGFNTWTVGY